MADEQRDWFQSTHWSVVLTARDGTKSVARQALESLCRTYWRPLYSFLRRDGLNEHDAQDVTQAFFAKLIDKGYLESVDERKGRFRSFLLKSIKNFRSNQRAYNRALKRGGDAKRVSFEYEDGERWFALMQTDQKTPDEEFE